MVNFLVTNGGPHPPDKWAALTGNKIADLVQVDELSDSDIAASARKAKPRFAIALADALEPIFGQVGAAERASVKSGDVTLRHAPFHVDGFLDPAISAVTGASASTPFASHFALSDVQAVVRNIIKQNFIDAANIERSWALDAKGL